MNIVRVNATLTEIDGRVRVERGPVRRNEIATKELLGDVTASHYHLPRKETVTDPATGKKIDRLVTALDALGKPIQEGKPFDFIDWKATHDAFYVYVHNGKLWEAAGTYEAEDKAMSAAVTVAAALPPIPAA